jgi:hypothetical protein
MNSIQISQEERRVMSINASVDAAQAMQSYHPPPSLSIPPTASHHHHYHPQHRQSMSAPSLPSTSTSSKPTSTANSAMKYISRSTSSILRSSNHEHDHSTHHSTLHHNVTPPLPEGTSNEHSDELPHSHHCQTEEDFNYALNLHMGVIGEIFGTPLHETSHGNGVPDIVLDCLLYLLHNSLTVEGIFRISGDEDTVADLRRSYDEGKSHPSFRTAHDHSPTTSHDLASLIKYYFRLLPEPLFPKKYYRSLTETLQLSDEEYVTQMRKMFLSSLLTSSEERGNAETIPVVNLKILSYLTRLFHEITRHTEQNKMTGDNLAIIFAPSILCPEGSHELGLYELQNGIAIMKRLLLHSVEIFEPLWSEYPLESAAEGETQTS